MKKFVFNWLLGPFLDAAIRPLVIHYFRENSLQEHLVWGDESPLEIAATAQVNNAFST